MSAISSIIGRIGRRTTLAITGGVAALAATVAIATAAVAGGGPDTPAPPKTSAPAASPSTHGNESPDTAPGDDASNRGRDDMSEGRWNGMEMGPGMADDSMEIGKSRMGDGMEMGRGMGHG